MVAAAIWIVVALLGVDLSRGRTTQVRYGVLVGLVDLAGYVTAAVFGGGNGMGVTIGAVATGTNGHPHSDRYQRCSWSIVRMAPLPMLDWSIDRPKDRLPAGIIEPSTVSRP